MKANKTLIGAFVVGAIGLAAAAVLLFGSGALFQERYENILFFDGSVAGLNPGAPVLLGGVKIGVVKDISLEFNLHDLTFKTPVVIETYDNFIFVDPNGQDRMPGKDKDSRREMVKRLVARGLRAQLKLQSFVTQQLAIELVFRPKTEIRLVGGDRSRDEIPTIHSEIEEFVQTIENLPIKEIVTDVRSALSRLNEALESAKRTLNSLETSVRGDSPLVHDTRAALQSLRDTLYSLRALIDYLERHPEALLKGKAEGRT